MNNCRIFYPEHAGEDLLSTMDFSGNKPAVPPLTTEAVATIYYLMDDD